MNREEWVTLAEAAAEFGFSQGHLRYLVSRGLVEGRKVGPLWVTTRQAVADYARDEFKRSKNPRKHKF